MQGSLPIEPVMPGGQIPFGGGVVTYKPPNMGPSLGMGPPPAMPLNPGAGPPTLTHGIPDPGAIARQKDVYLKMLDEQLKQSVTVLDQQVKYQRDYLNVQCEQQKKQFLLQLDQQMKAQEMVLTQEYNEQLMNLQMQAGSQKAALEQQAMQLAMEYEQRKAEESMYRQQYEIQKQQNDMAMKLQQDQQRAASAVASEQQRAACAAASATVPGTPGTMHTPHGLPRPDLGQIHGVPAACRPWLGQGYAPTTPVNARPASMTLSGRALGTAGPISGCSAPATGFITEPVMRAEPVMRP